MWKSVCCEIQGRGHVKTETPCQDKTIQLFQNNVNVIALADGAGSAKLSHYGAECVVENISAYITNNFQQLIENVDGKQVKLDIMEVVKNALNNKAIELECRLSDLASTLLLVAVSAGKYLIAHIGDGVIGYLDGTELKIASSPDNGEFANVTTFVTSDEALTSMRLFKGNVNNISGFVIMSDGTEQSLYHKTTKTLASAIIKLMHRTCLTTVEVMQSQLVETLVTVISKNTQDDCSIAILARPVGVLRLLEDLEIDERCDLFRINKKDKNMLMKVTRYDTIVNLLIVPKMLDQVAREIHLKPKYTKKHLNKLINVGLITKQGALYLKC